MSALYWFLTGLASGFAICGCLLWLQERSGARRC